MLGSAVERRLQKSGRKYFVSDKEVDITSFDTLNAFIRKQITRPADIEWIINCAAYTAVDKAEEEPVPAAFLNSIGPKNLARFAETVGAALIHVSTDYVFDGKKHSGYYEEDIPHPRSVYGRTKYAGEAAVAYHCPAFYIVRTAWLFGEDGGNFVKTMLARFRDGAAVRVVDDQWGSPTYAGYLAHGLCSFLTSEHPAPYGIYHYTNKGCTNWYEFAWEIYTQARGLDLCGPQGKIIPVKSSQYPTKAERPVYSVLHTEKISRALHLEIPGYTDALHMCLKNLKEDGTYA